MSFAFKKFNFFQQEEHKTHQLPTNTLCCVECPNICLVASDSGVVHALDSSFLSAGSFQAHNHKVISMLLCKNLLVTLGVEEPGISTATIKIWEIDKVAVAGVTSVQPLKAVKAFNSKYPESEVTALAVQDIGSNNLCIALGLGSGWVYVLQGDGAGKGKLQHTQRLAARPEHGDLWCVTGLHFQGGKDPLTLFAVTESQTLSFNVQTGAKTVLDGSGSRSAGCSLVRDGLLLVARDDAVHEYMADTRVGCTVLEHRKQQLLALRRYLVVVSSDTSDDGVSTSTVSIVDVKNKLLPGSFTLPNVQHVFTAWGAVHVLQGNGRLGSWREVELGVQLDALFKRSLHKVALEVAKAEAAPPDTIASIHQKWGDHLYSKGEFDAAMAQYQATLGWLEASYVVRRFLDAQRIHNLTSYLELLHERGLASADHTTLLLNCYTKLKDVVKLDAFVHRDDSSPTRAPLKFDAETAVRVLRGAGYHEHALWVAHRCGASHWELDILLEDMGDHSAAITFLLTLSRSDMATALRKYGKQLVQHRPEDTTALLMDLCSPGVDLDGESFTASVAEFAHLYADRPTSLMLLCEYVLNSQAAPPAEEMLYHTLLELYLAPALADEPVMPGDVADDTETEFDSSPQSRRARALDLLQRGWQPHLARPKYDPEHALLLTRTAGFKAGLLFLYDKLRLHREVLQVYIDHQDDPGLISACVRYGDAQRGGDPQLWAECLDYFCTRTDRDCTAQVVEVLEHIEAGRVLPLLVVLQALAKNRSLKLATVKGHVAAQLQRESADIQADRDAIAKLQAETSSMRAEASTLRSQPRVFQNSRCAGSGQPLEPPAVHFLCGHSFNLRSLQEGERQCPMCGPDQRRVLDIRRNMRAGALQQDRFFTELRETADGFSVVAEHFGRGIMNVTSSSTH